MEKRDHNMAEVCGQIQGAYRYHHEILGERFYGTLICIKRMSGSVDCIPLIVSERETDVHIDHTGETAEIKGQFRSYNLCQDDKKRLYLYLFAKEIRFLGTGKDSMYRNHLILEGYLCKKPVYRETPLGREIADILVAVNRAYGKSDYIPCICWGRNARYASQLQVGDMVRLDGRIQSREYYKMLETENGIISKKKQAYEVSVARVSLL